MPSIGDLACMPYLLLASKNDFAWTMATSVLTCSCLTVDNASLSSVGHFAAMLTVFQVVDYVG